MEFVFLRFKETEVRKNIYNVLIEVEKFIVHIQTTNPNVIEKSRRKANPPNP